MAELMEIDALYNEPQHIQVIAGNFWLSCMLASFGEFQCLNENTFQFVDKYREEGNNEAISVPVCRLSWPCKEKGIEKLLGKTYLNISICLSKKHPLNSKKGILDYINETYSGGEASTYSKREAKLEVANPSTNRPTNIQHTENPEEISTLSLKHSYTKINPINTGRDINPTVLLFSISQNSALEFCFIFEGFSTKNNSDLTMRDLLLEKICEEFMSHVELTPLPYDERPQITEKPAATDSW